MLDVGVFCLFRDLVCFRYGLCLVIAQLPFFFI